VKCDVSRKSRLLTLREHDLARLNGAAEEPSECAQRERDPGEACMALAPHRSQRETPRVWKPCRKGERAVFRPLTAEVRVI
jgi:hypothetical protein